ncbi:MAG: flagellar biosynthetic protein FliQ [Myxococcales bacterium]|nr:flagellar biosynthetic protein FliQ [Myxococcales bacterium]
MLLQIAKDTLLTALMVGGPLLGVTLAAGLLVSVFQTVTSINEATLTFVPKVAAAVLVVILLFPFMSDRLITFTRDLYLLIPQMRN